MIHSTLFNIEETIAFLLGVDIKSIDMTVSFDDCRIDLDKNKKYKVNSVLEDWSKYTINLNDMDDNPAIVISFNYNESNQNVYGEFTKSMETLLNIEVNNLETGSVLTLTKTVKVDVGFI